MKEFNRKSSVPERAAWTVAALGTAAMLTGVAAAEVGQYEADQARDLTRQAEGTTDASTIHRLIAEATHDQVGANYLHDVSGDVILGGAIGAVLGAACGVGVSTYRDRREQELLDGTRTSPRHLQE
jgi:hypothetical protein